MKVPLSRFLLNSHTTWFHPQIQKSGRKSEPQLVQHNRQHHRKVLLGIAFIWMVKRKSSCTGTKVRAIYDINIPEKLTTMLFLLKEFVHLCLKTCYVQRLPYLKHFTVWWEHSIKTHTKSWLLTWFLYLAKARGYSSFRLSDRHRTWSPSFFSGRVFNFILNYGSSCLSLPATELLSSSSFLTGCIIEEDVTATAKYKWSGSRQLIRVNTVCICIN